MPTVVTEVPYIFELRLMDVKFSWLNITKDVLFADCLFVAESRIVLHWALFTLL